ncbi:prepilin peptidase [Spongiactinospora sp. 9N601]|uniref:prepilin peptidase n=1 Tax=Spongiactinospora sp. 9N601 TaxID=3375149 RepID=UPI0037BA5D47
MPTGLIVGLIALVAGAAGLWQRESVRRHVGDGPDGRYSAGAYAVVTAVALAGPAMRFESPWELAAYGWLVVAAVPLAVIDVADFRLPDELTITAYAGVTILLAVEAVTAGRPGDLQRAGAGAIALAGFYALLFIVRPAALGLGDVKLALALGTALGWTGWDSVIAAVVLTHLFAAVYGVALLAARRAHRATEIPFGPFMILGALVVLHAW